MVFGISFDPEVRRRRAVQRRGLRTVKRKRKLESLGFELAETRQRVAIARGKAALVRERKEVKRLMGPGPTERALRFGFRAGRAGLGALSTFGDEPPRRRRRRR